MQKQSTEEAIINIKSQVIFKEDNTVFEYKESTKNEVSESDIVKERITNEQEEEI